MNMRSTKHFGFFACFFKRQTSRGDGLTTLILLLLQRILNHVHTKDLWSSDGARKPIFEPRYIRLNQDRKTFFFIIACTL